MNHQQKEESVSNFNIEMPVEIRLQQQQQTIGNQAVLIDELQGQVHYLLSLLAEQAQQQGQT